MEEGTKVRNHVLKMMDYLNEVEIHGVQVNDKTKINMVIEYLPDTFNKFKVSYILNNKDTALLELMHELHAIEEFYHSRKLPKKRFPSSLSRKIGRSKKELGSTNYPLKEVASQKASVTNVDRRVTGRKIVLRLLKSSIGNF